jgi:hypothetical protein
MENLNTPNPTIFESPRDFFSYISSRVPEGSAPNIPPRVLYWIYDARKNYDPNCSCPKEDVEKVDQEYKKIPSISDSEKNLLLLFLKETYLVFKFNGITIGKIIKKTF